MHFGVFVKRRPSALSEIQTNENPNDLLRYTKVQNSKTLKSEIQQKIQNTKEGQSNSPECNEPNALSEVLSVQCLTS